MQDSVYHKKIAYLEQDFFQNLATLKYLTEYQDTAAIQLVEDLPQWAVLISIPTDVLSYDTETYPQAETAIFLNGTSEKLKCDLLGTLSNKNYILRLNEEFNLSLFKHRFKILKGNSFSSYTCSMVEESSIGITIPAEAQLTDESLHIIMRNGYSEPEVRGYFEKGARWFGLTKNHHIQSICFVYQNYATIWEIAGVHTLEESRNQGYAKMVVTAALKYLLDRNLLPRYNVDDQNQYSLKVALSLNMEQFLHTLHFLLIPL